MVRFVLLDQNKWIELAKAASGQSPEAELYLDRCVSAVQKGDAIFPLNWAHIFETQKIRNEQRRLALACLMSTLSAGTLFRSRQEILVTQLQDFYAEALSIKAVERPANWFIAKNLTEAFPEEFAHASPMLKAFVTDYPVQALDDWIGAGADDELLKKTSTFASSQIKKMEDRRARWQSESVAVHRRAHSALIFLESQDTVIQTLLNMGVDPIVLREKNGRLVRQIMNKVPLLRVEREMSYRIELEPRPINENDLRDFSSFCTAFALGFEIVGEKASVGRLIQTGLPSELNLKVCSSFEQYFSE